MVTIYSTFLQRAFDQIVHDVCLQNLPVIFAIDRGGLVGQDGPTHHGQFDITYLRSLPNMVLMAPKDENELRNMLYTALQHEGPIAVRYPRGNGAGVPFDSEYKAIPIGEAEIVREGEDLVIFAFGSMVYPSLDAALMLEKEGLKAGVVNCRFAKPLDRKLLEIASAYGRVLVVEENTREGGFGSAILEFFNDEGLDDVRVRRMGLPDEFVEQGSPAELKKKYGLDSSGIFKEATDFCQRAKEE